MGEPPTPTPPPPGRRPDRPRLDTMLAVRVSAKQFDLAYTLARASRVSMGEYVRRALRAATTRDRQ